LPPHGFVRKNAETEVEFHIAGLVDHGTHPESTHVICKLVHLSNVSRTAVLAGSRPNVMIVKHTASREFAA
jgi:hypothetical protein